MIELRPFAELGGENHGWLNAKHHFSFADYRDPQRMHWGNLRVWNDDIIAPQTGFPPHSHRDMEIITNVREGAITHEDNRGYLVPAIGLVEIDGVRINARDGAAISDIQLLRVTAIEDSEIVLVDAA